MLQPENQWQKSKLVQYQQKLGQAMLSDEHTLALFRDDFGKLTQGNPSAVCEPTSLEAVQSLVHYAYENQLSLTVRGNGMSQNGQSLAPAGGLVLSMKHLNQTWEPEQDSIWVEANATWASLLERSIKHSLVPYVVPHNCHLSVAGVLSAGGIGAASFKYGSTLAHVRELEIVQAHGEITQVSQESPLFQACLGGQGRFGVISKARIALRSCQHSARTFFLTYDDHAAWLKDLLHCQKIADYVESFCTPALQGAKLTEHGRSPFAHWLYAIHVTLEYEHQAPDFADLGLRPWKLLHSQDESLHAYLQRHDSRFNAMKITGQWDLQHLWYECFVKRAQLEQLEELLAKLPIHYAQIVHITPVANRTNGFLMFPQGEDIFTFMILNPGLAKPLVPGGLETMKQLDALFLSQGAKRYLSGYLGESIDIAYWKKHFAERYSDWVELKKRYDPRGIFCSVLHHTP